MVISETITSRQNPKIKNLIHLQKSSERRLQNIFLIEGIKEIEKAIEAGYDFEAMFFSAEILKDKTILEKISASGPVKTYEVSLDVFDKIAYREGSGGIIVLARPMKHGLSELPLPQNPLVLVIESVEKPGNTGAIYRTADAAGVDAVIICDPKTDIYNPNAIRASLGCVFTVPTALTTSEEAIKFLKNNNITIYSTYLNAALPYDKVDFTKPSAIIMGTEATGLSKAWVDASNSNIIIPMKGKADSLNVGISAAIVVFEAVRQRSN